VSESASETTLRAVKRSCRANVANSSVPTGIVVLTSEEWTGVVRASPSTKHTWLIATPKSAYTDSCARSARERGMRTRARQASTNNTAAAATTRMAAQERTGTCSSTPFAAR